MNGKKAKKIRKAVYGDNAHRAKEYVNYQGDGSRRSVGLRRLYQLAKRQSKQ